MLVARRCCSEVEPADTPACSRHALNCSRPCGRASDSRQNGTSQESRFAGIVLARLGSHQADLAFAKKAQGG